MSMTIKKDLPLLLMGLVGIIIMLELFFPVNVISQTTKTLTSWGVLLVAMATGVGVVNLTKRHIKPIIKQEKQNDQWFFSAVLIVTMYATIMSGILGGTKHQIYLNIFNYIYTPVNGSIYAMLAFWIVSAAYRSLKAKSTEAMVLLVVVLIMLMKDTPLIVANIPIVAQVANWITTVLGPGGCRGIIISSGIGVLMFNLRMLIGKNPKAIGAGQDE